MIQGMDNVLEKFDELMSQDWVAVASEVKTQYQESIFKVDAIDTGRLIQSIDFEKTADTGDLIQYLIGSQKDVFVTYDGYVEWGTRYMPARYPAQKGIEAADISGTIDTVVKEVFGVIG